jgi:hypothetical protein
MVERNRSIAAKVGDRTLRLVIGSYKVEAVWIMRVSVVIAQ